MRAAGILRIEKHDDRLVLRNPGTLLIPIENVYAGASSKARNPRIQNLMRMIGYGENIDSGFSKILNAWKEAGWKEPLLENDLATDEVKLTLYVRSEAETTPGYYPKTILKISGAQKNIMDYLREHPNANITELASAIGSITENGVKYSLKVLRQKGYLRKIGPNKGGFWEVMEPNAE